MRWRLGASAPLWIALCSAIVTAALAIPLWVTASGIVDHLSGGGSGIDWNELWQALGNTAQWATSAALLATLCALPVALLAVRYPGTVSSLVERSTWVAHALPGVIMALSLVYISVQWFYPLYQTSTLLVIGYVVMFLPLAVGAQQVGIAQASVQLDEMSRALGRDRSNLLPGHAAVVAARDRHRRPAGGSGRRQRAHHHPADAPDG